MEEKQGRKRRKSKKPPLSTPPARVLQPLRPLALSFFKSFVRCARRHQKQLRAKGFLVPLGMISKLFKFLFFFSLFVSFLLLRRARARANGTKAASQRRL